MKKTKLISCLLAVCLGITGIAATTTVLASADASESTTNKTLLMSSGYKSGVFAPVSNLNDRKGATVEFDLYENDMKELNYNKGFDCAMSSGTSGSLACASFVFGKVDNYPYETQPQNFVWAISSATTSDVNFGGFQYFCNGQIKEWAYQGNNKVITEYLGDPSGFMDEGYSYKVMLRYDEFEYDGETYGGSAWYCVERKGIFDDDSAYELLFAFEKQVLPGAIYSNGTIAGMEVQGLCAKANLYGTATSADGKGYSVNMELDNLRIYDGDTYADADKKYAEDFESVTEDKLALPEMTAGIKINKHGDKNYLKLPSGIRHVSANHSQAMGRSDAEAACSLGLSSKELFQVTFKDKTTGEVVGVRNSYKGLDFRGAKIFDGEKVYKFDYSGIDFATLESPIEIYGTSVSYFNMRLVSGVSGINDKTQRVSVSGKFKITEDLLVREDYDLIGFTKQADGTTVEYKIGDTVYMNCDDMTLYALWQMKKYTTEYVSGSKVVNSIVSRPRAIPYYQGSTPTKAGHVFAGWSETIEAAQSDKKITANFVEMADTNAGNKVVSVNGALSLRHEGYASFTGVDVFFDLITLPANASVSVLGADITQFVSEGYKVKATVSPTGKIDVYKAYIGSEVYEYVGAMQTTENTNSYMEIDFNGNIVFDTLTMSYDGINTYEENFEGIESISEGIYNNYYMVSGAAEVVALAKDKAVTFVDTTTGRELEKVYTYAGGNVALLKSVEGVVSDLAWDKTQEQLTNVQSDITVNAQLTWRQCEVSFVINGIFDFIPVTDTLAPMGGIYGDTIALPTLVKENYAIIGWTDQADGAYALYTGEYVLSEESTTLYAVWGGKTLKVEFYAEDGETLLEAQEVEYNATVLFGGEVPVKEGYDFVGWSETTVGVKEDTKFMAQYEKSVAKVQVSVLGGTGAGKYNEGDTVTIAFRDISGFKFTGWRVVSGDVTITEKDGVYTFVAGAKDVVIEAVVEEASTSGCSASVGAGVAGLITLCGAAFIAMKRKEHN